MKQNKSISTILFKLWIALEERGKWWPCLDPYRSFLKELWFIGFRRQNLYSQEKKHKSGLKAVWAQEVNQLPFNTDTHNFWILKTQIYIKMSTMTQVNIRTFQSISIICFLKWTIDRGGRQKWWHGVSPRVALNRLRGPVYYLEIKFGKVWLQARTDCSDESPMQAIFGS